MRLLLLSLITLCYTSPLRAAPAAPTPPDPTRIILECEDMQGGGGGAQG